MRLLPLFLALSLLLAPLPAAAATVDSVNFAEQVRLGNEELQLNGAGMRAKLWFKVYAIGLYLGEKKGSGAEVAAQKGAKRLHIVTLRELSAEDFAKALIDGLHKNYDAAAYAALAARAESLRQTILALRVAPKGAQIQLDWLPAAGTRLTYNGDKQGEDLPGEDFYKALLSIWLGEHPAAQDLKEALLGKPH